MLIDAAQRRKRIEQRFVDRLDAGGFSEVILPILDYVDVYAPVATTDVSKRTYRFTDRDGELVALRSDFTPMVARALAPSLDAADLPLRVYYRGDVIRCDRSRLGANREMFQIGAEIIGDASIDIEIELLELVADLAGDAAIVYTDSRVADARFLKSGATIDDVRPFSPLVADRLAQIEARLDSRFRLDLADADDASSYYTGLRFSVYGNASRNKIAQGGRYDTLYERFGAAAPAVGFTFTIDDLD